MENKRPEMEHKIIEIFNLNPSLIKDYKSMEEMVKGLIKTLDLIVVKEEYHNFDPQGVTAVFILSSSHLAVHTWPERGYLHIDLLTCKKLPEDEDLIKSVSEIFRVDKKSVEVREVLYEN